MTDETKYEWFHKDREFFFLKEDDEVTHCYRLARVLGSEIDFNRWWRVMPVPQAENLTPVAPDSEIGYQLASLDEDGDFPPAGFFVKNIRATHPRRNQWSKLHALRTMPKDWHKRGFTVSADRDFVTAPFLAEYEREKFVGMTDELDAVLQRMKSILS